jgi:ribonuclease G
MDTKDSDTKLHDNGETHPHAHDEPVEEKESLDFGHEPEGDDTPPPQQTVHDVTQDIVDDIPEDILEDIPARPGEVGAVQDDVPPARDLVIETEPSGTPELEGDIPMGQEPPGLEPQLRPGPQRGRRDSHGRPMQGGHGRDRGRDRNRDRHRDNRDTNNRDHNRDHNRDRGPRPEVRRDIKIVKNEILVNCSPEETRVGVVEENQLIELMVDRTESEKIVGNIYKGRVDNVLPGISSAFVNIGLEKNAYLYVSDVIPMGKRAPSSQIEKMISRNEVMMVQVAKEAIGTKGVKITMDISLPGRHLVYMPMAEHVGVSKNIEDRKERERLRSIVDKCAPEKGGVIIRTEAEGAEEEALKREMAYLIRLWEGIQKRFESLPVPSLVHRDLGLVFQTVRDIFTENTSIFLVDSRGEYKDLMEFLDSISPELKSRVKLYEGKTPLFQAFNIESQIEKIRSARVDLPSGGYIIIQEAEGLCAIDVNTGKFTGKRSQEETVTATNVEAAKESARQLRLRNIGGIIVIDFIDMRHARNRQKVMEALAHYTHTDRAKIKILPITRLGLIEMTRERKRESLFALLGEACPQCHASGRVLSKESMYIKLKREMLLLTHGRPGNQLKLYLNPAVAHYFQERHQRIENFVKHKLIINADPHLPWEEYRILVE